MFTKKKLLQSITFTAISITTIATVNAAYPIDNDGRTDIWDLPNFYENGQVSSEYNYSGDLTLCPNDITIEDLDGASYLNLTTSICILYEAINEIDAYDFTNDPSVNQDKPGNASLERITIWDETLHTVHPKAFYDLPNLKKIDLRHTKISNISPEMFVNLPKLEQLLIDSDNLNVIKNTMFTGMDLLDLSVSGNITDIEPNSFQNLPNRWLTICGGNIPTIKKEMLQGGKMFYLSLYNNNITEINNDAFNGLYISYLDLDNNKLSSFNIANYQLADLGNLDLHDNEISNINGDFSGCPYLNKINLEHNKLSNCEFTFNRINDLYLKYNDLNSINFVNTNLTLYSLSVDSNKIKSISIAGGNINATSLNTLTSKCYNITSATLLNCQKTGDDYQSLDSSSIQKLLNLSSLNYVKVSQDIYQTFKNDFDTWNNSASNILIVK